MPATAAFLAEFADASSVFSVLFVVKAFHHRAHRVHRNIGRGFSLR
jgi:hypothetical protein